jgi:hypothetical protein
MAISLAPRVQSEPAAMRGQTPSKTLSHRQTKRFRLGTVMETIRFMILTYKTLALIVGVLVFVLGVLPLGPLGSWKAHFVRGDLGENLFRVYFAVPFRSSRPNLGPNNPLHKCACAPNPKRVKRGG